MNRIREVFGVARVLLPVIHPVGPAEALTSVEVAVAAGVKGVFLINQGMTANEVLALVMELRIRHPRLWVGINILGFAPAHVLHWALSKCEGRLDGIWSDDASIHDGAASQPEAQSFIDARAQLGWTGLYFGGVAFKYQREVPADRLTRVAETAAGLMDVVCTSGPGTGRAADVGKLEAMREGLGGHALALASGVTVDNVERYLPHVDAYLVGTGIERSFGILDPDRVARLHQQIEVA